MQAFLCDPDFLIDLFSRIIEEDRSRAICQMLLDEFGSMERILSATPEQLCPCIEGTSAEKNKLVFLLESAKALTKRRYTHGFTVGKAYTEEEIVKYLIGLFMFDNVETIYMLSFDRLGIYLGTDSFGAGTVNNSNVTTRRALELALRRGASCVIFAHNHPLGHAMPSNEDMSTTYQLSRSFATVNIELREHYIIAGNDFRKINAEISRDSGFKANQFHF